MTAENPFVLEKADYKRDLNLFKHYANDVAFYLSVTLDKPIEDCREFIKRGLAPGGKFEFKDPTVKYLERIDQADRIIQEGTLSQFLGDSVKNQELISPNLSTYLPAHVEQSFLANFIDFNVKERSQAKKAMFVAEMAGDWILKDFKENEQKSRKIRNNSISGGHLTASTPLYNKTSHSTLTSNCRSTSGFGNANNEKLLCGNRHYWNQKIALNNLVSIPNHSDLPKMQAAMDKFGIRAPTVEETMECILYSTNLYWHSPYAEGVLRSLVEKYTPIQRAAFVYTGDLYHLAKWNDAFVRPFITKLATRLETLVENPGKILKEVREEYVNLACMFFTSDLIAISEKLFPADHPDPKIKNKSATLKDIKGLPLEAWIAATAQHIDEVVFEYRDFIEAFLVTDNVPASLAFFPDSIRRCALTSDTDSTIFTVQDWTFWIHGKNPGFNDATTATASTMVFLASETITHILARMSANFGIETKRIHQVAMKNEFFFPLFAPTQVGKHYYAAISAQEGNVFRKYKLEKKGVHLKSSSISKFIVKDAEAMMRDILETCMRGEELSIVKYLTWVANIEREVQRSILAGESTYLRNAQIKMPNAYSQPPMRTPWQHYDLWQEVFAPKYGDAPLPPYAASKVAIELNSATDVRNWIEAIEDKELGKRMQGWLTKHDKGPMTAFILPQQTLAMKGMPKEIAQIAAIRRSVWDCTAMYYLLLSSIGYYAHNENLTHLCMDYY